MRVDIFLNETSQRITFDKATNTYTKGPFYCVYLKDENKVYKYPIAHLFNVREDYSGKEPMESGTQRRDTP